MTTFDTTVFISDWYSEGFGVNMREKKAKKRFQSTTDALSWAYSEVYKYHDKPKNRNTAVTRCYIDLKDGGMYYRVQLTNYKVRIYYARIPNGVLSRGFLLNKDGTINFRGGGIA